MARLLIQIFGALLCMGAGGALARAALAVVSTGATRGTRVVVWGYIGVGLGALVLVLGLVGLVGVVRKRLNP